MKIEVRHLPEGMLDSERMQLALDLGEMVSATADWKEQAEAWLKEKGFHRVDWLLSDQDDILVVALWRYNPLEPGKLADEFLIKYSGYDAMNVQLYCLTEEQDI